MAARKLFRSRVVVVFVLVLGLVFGSMCVTRPAYALDRRLSLAMKTAGYGAGAGFIVGAGTYALGIGSWKNMLMGASLGLYAGIGLAAYLIVTQDDYVAQKRRHNPYAPRRPVGPDGWEDDEDEHGDDYREHLPPESDDDARMHHSIKDKTQELALWSPIVTFRF